MDSFNPCYGSSHQFQQRAPASNGDFKHVAQASGVWSSANIPPTPSPSEEPAIANSISSPSSDEDDWEPVITDFTNYNNNRNDNFVPPSFSIFEEEEWTLGDGNNQYASSYGVPYGSQNSGDENTDEGFLSLSEQSSNSSQHDSVNEQMQCHFYDEDSYMDTSNDDCFQDSFAVPAEISPRFKKKPVKRDWCGNLVFHDDWNEGVRTAPGSGTKSKFGSNSNSDGKEVHAAFKRRCN